MKRKTIISVAIAGILVSGCSAIKYDPLVNKVTKSAEKSQMSQMSNDERKIIYDQKSKEHSTTRYRSFLINTNKIEFAVEKDVLKQGCVSNLPCLVTDGKFFNIKELEDIKFGKNEVQKNHLTQDYAIFCGISESNEALCSNADFAILTPTGVLLDVVIPIGSTIMNLGMNWAMGEKVGHTKYIDYDKLEEIFIKNKNVIEQASKIYQENKAKTQIEMFQ